MSIMQTVMEAYAGKSKELLKCEEYIKEISDMIYHDHDVNGLTSKRSVNRNAEPCRKLQETLAKFFKVKEVNIFWAPGDINAYSIPGSSMIIAARDKKGDFSAAKLEIIVYENLVYDCDMNEKEILGIILHEIGHCFYNSPFLVGSELLGYVMEPVSIVTNFVGNALLKLCNRGDDWIKRNIPLLYNLFAKIDDFKIQIFSITRYLTIFPDPTIIIRKAEANLANPLQMVGKYGGERGADSFATKYGYGAELISALNKLERMENTVGSKAIKTLGGFGDFVYDYNNIICTLFSMLSLDPHPNNDLRAQTMIRKLERDLVEEDYPIELKKDLNDEIVRLKKIYATIHDNESNVEIKKGWYNMINTITRNHSDIREIFNAFYVKYEF